MGMDPRSRHVYRYDGLRYAAAGGMIWIQDDRTGELLSVSVKDFKLRSKAIGMEASRCLYGDERQKLTNVANDMEKCIAEAQAQGDPTNAVVMAHNLRHGVHRRPFIVAPKLPGGGIQL